MLFYKQGDESPFPDLINNRELFESIVTETQLGRSWNDNTSYREGNYMTLEEVSDEFEKDPYQFKNQLINVLVPDEYIWSSDNTLSDDGWQGYDRPRTQDPTVAHGHLNKKNDDGESIGFDASIAGSLNGKIRIVYDKESGKIIGLIISKSRGNIRTCMKMLANNGNPTELLMQLSFHDLENPPIFPEHLKIEAPAHFREHDSSKGMTAQQKFVSGVATGDRNLVELAEWLNTRGVDFGGAVNALYKPFSEPNYPQISNIGGMTTGLSGGIFATEKYGGIDAITWGLDTAKRLREITEEKGMDGNPEISIAAVKGFAAMYEVFCESLYVSQVNHQPILYSDTLREYLIAKYTEQKQSTLQDDPKLRKLVETSTNKDHRSVVCKELFADLIAWIKRTQGKKYSIGKQNPHMVKFLNKIKDEHLRSAAEKIIEAAGK